MNPAIAFSLRPRRGIRVASVITPEATLHAALPREVKPLIVRQNPVVCRTRRGVGQASIGLLHIVQTSRQIACAMGLRRTGMIRVVMLGEPNEGRTDIGGRSVAGYTQDLVEIAMVHRVRRFIGRNGSSDATGIDDVVHGGNAGRGGIMRAEQVDP